MKLLMVKFFSLKDAFVIYLTSVFTFFFLTFYFMLPIAIDASEDAYLRQSNFLVWQLIHKKTSPPASPYKPSELRRSSHKVRFLEKSPIDYKERELGSQEAKGSFQGNVRSRSEDLNQIPRSHESSTPFYGNAEGRNIMNYERSIPQPRIKKKHRSELRQTNNRIQELISQWKYE